VIILWGLETDDPLRAVLECLRRMREEVIFVDQATRYSGLDIELEVGSQASGTISLSGRRFDLGSVSSVFLRPYDIRRLVNAGESEADAQLAQHALAVEDILQTWVSVTSSLVVNRPSDMSSNSSKPFQAELIRSAGFLTPETLLTTDPNAAEEFWERHGEVVYKSISGVRSIVRRLSSEHRKRIEDVVNCPVQFQEYIDGSDYRVHVVGERVFSCEIISSADDYRYGSMQGDSAKFARKQLPDDLVTRCKELARRCGLVLAGIDLRLNSRGDWYCFEVNPSPAFTVYEGATGDPISEAVAQLLARGAALSSTSERQRSSS